jgi:hypothetical protein
MTGPKLQPLLPAKHSRSAQSNCPFPLRKHRPFKWLAIMRPYLGIQPCRPVIGCGTILGHPGPFKSWSSNTRAPFMRGPDVSNKSHTGPSLGGSPSMTGFCGLMPTNIRRRPCEFGFRTFAETRPHPQTCQASQRSGRYGTGKGICPPICHHGGPFL